MARNHRLPSEDLAFPFENPFAYLEIDESLTDHEILKQLTTKRNEFQDRLKRLTSNAPEICGSLQHNVGLPVHEVINGTKDLAELRREVNQKRINALKPFAKALENASTLSDDQRREALRMIATEGHVHPSFLDEAEKQLLPGPLSLSPPPPHSPSGAITAGNLFFENFQLGSLDLPFWSFLPVIAFAVSFFNYWSGGVLILGAFVAAYLLFRWESGRSAAKPARNFIWACAILAAALPGIIMGFWLPTNNGSRIGKDTQRPVINEIQSDESDSLLAAPHYPREAPFLDFLISPANLQVRRDNKSSHGTHLTDGDTETGILTTGEPKLEAIFELPIKERVDGIAFFLTGHFIENPRPVWATATISSSKRKEALELLAYPGWQVVPFDVETVDRVTVSFDIRDDSAGVTLNEMWLMRAGETSGRRWAGNWDTNWGELHLIKKGNWFHGNYGDQNASGSLLLKEISTGILYGLWEQEPDRDAPNNGGAIQVEGTSDGTGFRGYWVNGFIMPELISLDPFEAKAMEFKGNRFMDGE